MKFLLAVLLCACSVPAWSATRIQFDATSTASSPGGGFVIDVAPPVIGKSFPASVLAACHVDAGWTCAGGAFGDGGADTVQFNARNDSTGDILGSLYFFPIGAFTTAGTYSGQSATLTVSFVDGPGALGAVPEPGTCAMMLLGFLFIGLRHKSLRSCPALQ